MKTNFKELEEYDYKNDCPILYFGRGTNSKEPNEFFNILDQYYEKLKKFGKIFDAFEEDKKEKSIKGIKAIIGDIDIMKKELFDFAKIFKNYNKAEFSDTSYTCFETQKSLDNLFNNIYQMEKHINELMNLINSKQFISKIDKFNEFKDDHEFFHRKIKLFLPSPNNSNKTVDFSQLNEK